MSNEKVTPLHEKQRTETVYAIEHKSSKLNVGQAYEVTPERAANWIEKGFASKTKPKAEPKEAK